MGCERKGGIKDDSKGFDLSNLKNGVAVRWGKTVGCICWRWGGAEFIFGHLKFEMPITYFNQEVVRCMNLELGEKTALEL